MERFNAYIEESKVNMKKRIEAMVSDGYEDDTRPLRASFNIYDVFLALATAAFSKSKGDAAVFKKEFHKLAEKIPSNWKKSLEVAKEHNDAEKIMIEEAKLATADEIVMKFDELF